MKTVLLPYDGSDTAKRALQYLIDLSKDYSGFSVHVLNVQFDPQIYGRSYTAFIGDALKQLREDTQKYAIDMAEQAAAKLREAGINTTAHASVDTDIAFAVGELIKSQKCDSIVMGTRGMSGLGNLFLGSVATRIIHQVDIPVTLIK